MNNLLQIEPTHRSSSAREPVVDWRNVDPVKLTLLLLGAVSYGSSFYAGDDGGVSEREMVAVKRRLTDLESAARRASMEKPAQEAAQAGPASPAGISCEETGSDDQAWMSCSYAGRAFMNVAWVLDRKEAYLVVRDGTWQFKCREGRDCRVSTPGVFEGTVRLAKNKDGEFAVTVCKAKEKPWQIARAATGFRD